MSVANKIFTNTVWQMSIRAVNILIGVFSIALITRMLGSTGFGFYTTISAFVQIFMILADLGLYLTLLREISKAKDSQEENSIINNIFTIRVLFSLLVMILVPVAVNFFPYTQEVKTGVVYFMGALFFQSLITTITAVFSKKLEMYKVAIADLVQKVFYLASLLYLFVDVSSLNLILGFNTISNSIGLFVILYFLRKHAKLRLAWDFDYWKKIFYIAWPLAITVVLNLLYFKADTLVLSVFHSPEAVGLYGAPYRVLEVISTFPHMFLSLILPLLTTAWMSKNIKKFNEILQYNFDFFSILIVGMIVLLVLVSTPLMVALAGSEFAQSGPILNLLIVATASIFYGTLFTYAIVSLGKQKQMVKYFLITAMVGVVGYFVFIPPFSYWGAASMTLVVELMMVAFAWHVVKKNIDIKINMLVFKKSLLAGVCTFVLAWFVGQASVWLTVVTVLIFYPFILYLLKVTDRASLKMLIIGKK